MKLTDSEKSVIEFVSILSGLPQNSCKEVFFGFLLVLTIALKKGDKNIDVPYLGNISLDLTKVAVKNKFEIVDQFQFVVSPSLKTMINDVLVGKETVLNKYMKIEIVKALAEKLDITEEELQEELQNLIKSALCAMQPTPSLI